MLRSPFDETDFFSCQVNVLSTVVQTLNRGVIPRCNLEKGHGLSYCFNVSNRYQQGLMTLGCIYLHTQTHKQIMNCTSCVFSLDLTQCLTFSFQSQTVSSKPLSTLRKIVIIYQRYSTYTQQIHQVPTILTWSRDLFFLLHHECLSSI